ncbi:MAG: phage major capsid protein [Pseudomonadota bacterium]
MSETPSQNRSKTLQAGSRLFRAVALDRAAVDEAARTVTVAFSSEMPYERYWGREILDHSPTSVRLGRLAGGGPLLMDHDARDHVGVIESVEIGADRVGRAVVRFGRSARAEEVFRDVLDGIRRNVSVGYIIHKAVLVESDGDIDTYRVTDWEPFEISLVAVPADPTVGVGRAAEASPVIEIIEEKRAMSQPPLNEQDLETRGAEAERRRVADLIAIGEQFKRYGAERLAAEAIRAGTSVDAFRAKLMEHIATHPMPTAEIGLSDREARQFSLVRLLNALANPEDRRAREAAAFEFECSRAVADKMGRAPKGVFVPYDVLKRDLNVGTPTAGGHLVATNLLAQDFIELLRNAMVLDRLGVRMLTGLVGNIAIPRQTGGAAAYWVTEGGAPTESQQAFDQVAMSPKTVAAFTDLSRKLLLQASIDVEAFVRQDLATTLGLELERAAINGAGAGAEPRGVLNTTGIGDVAGGANGAAPTWAHIVELETDVAVANAAVGNLAYLSNAKVRGKLKQTEKATGTAQFVWEKGAQPGEGEMNGYLAAMTNAVPSNLTKGTSTGVCSAILFGNWADLVIGLWGGLDVLVNPYILSGTGAVRVEVYQDADIALRHPESFSAMKDALTS